MKHFFLKSAMMLLLTSMFLVSCKDKDPVEEPGNSAADNANAQGAFDDMGKVTEEALSENKGARIAAGGKTVLNCADVDTLVLSATSKQLTITFNGSACTDGKVRSGTIDITLTNGATYNTPGAILTIKTKDYTVNGNKLIGKKVVTCVTGNPNNVHKIVVSDTVGTGFAKLIYANGESTTWKSARTRTLVSGGGSPDTDITNNIYDISATPGVGNPIATGFNRNDKGYTVDIISPIRVDFNCLSNNTARYPTQGVFSITPDGMQDISIDYGTGVCDNAVTIVYLGKTYERTLSY